MNSSCSNAVRFDLGYNATNFAADTKFVEQVNCGAPSYRLLRGLTAGGSSLVGFPLIYKIKSKTYNSATSKYLYKFDVYKDAAWGLTNVINSSIANSSGLNIHLTQTAYYRPDFAEVPFPSLTGATVNCNPCCWTNKPVTGGRFIAYDRNTDLPLWGVKGHWPKPAENPCLNYWQGPYPHNMGHQLPCNLIQAARERVQWASANAAFSETQNTLTLLAQNHSLHFKSYNEMVDFERHFEQIHPLGQWYKKYVNDKYQNLFYKNIHDDRIWTYDPLARTLVAPVIVPKGFYLHERLKAGYTANSNRWQFASYLSCTPDQVSSSLRATLPCQNSMTGGLDNYFYDNDGQPLNIGYNVKKGIYGYIVTTTYGCNKIPEWGQDWNKMIYSYNLHYYDKPLCPFNYWLPPNYYPHNHRPCKPKNWSSYPFPYKFKSFSKFGWNFGVDSKLVQCGGQNHTRYTKNFGFKIDIPPNYPAPPWPRCGDTISWWGKVKDFNECNAVGRMGVNFIAEGGCIGDTFGTGKDCEYSSSMIGCEVLSGYGNWTPTDSGVSYKCYRACSSHHATLDKRPGDFRGTVPAQGPQAIWKDYWKEIPCGCSSISGGAGGGGGTSANFVLLANDTGGLHVYSVDSSGNLTHLDSDDQGDEAWGVWSDGNFIYLANGHGLGGISGVHGGTVGLHTYSIDSSGNLTHIDYNSGGGGSQRSALNIWGDGNFIYVAYDTDGLHVFSVNGSGYLTHIDSFDPGWNAQDVWGDGNFVYVANRTGGLDKYAVNNQGNLAHVENVPANPYGLVYRLHGHGNFIYGANDGYGVRTYSTNSSGNLYSVGTTGAANTGLDYSGGIWTDGNFVYALDGYHVNASKNLYAYSVNSSGSLTLTDSVSHGTHTGAWASVWGDGNFVYVANSVNGLYVYSVDSSGNLTYIDSDDQGDTARGVWAGTINTT